MTSNDYFSLILIVIIIAYALYNLYKVGKVFNEHMNSKKAFITKSKGKYDTQQDYTLWVAIFVVILVVSIVMMAKNMMAKEYLTTAAFLFLFIFCISLIMDALITRQALFDEDGFFYETKYYRFRTISDLKPRSSLMPSYDMYLSTGSSVRISRKMGDRLEKELKAYKQRKKNRK